MNSSYSTYGTRRVTLKTCYGRMNSSYSTYGTCRVTLKTCYGRMNSSYSTYGTRRVTLKTCYGRMNSSYSTYGTRRVTLKTCYGRMNNSCSTYGTRRVTLKNKRGDKSWIRKGRIVITTSGIYPWSFMTHIFRNSSPEKLASRRRQAKQKHSTLPRFENYTNFWLVKTPGIKKNIFPDVARPCYRV